MPKQPQDLEKFESLMEIVAHLRGPEGCPWDKEQTHRTLAPYAVEEIYEMIDALEKSDDSKLKEELGDVLFQVALHTQLAQERKAFQIRDVLYSINEKMVRRHPHVFSDVKVQNSEEVWKNWEKIKKSEQKNEQSRQIDIPETIPALQRAYKIGVKTQKAGFDWTRLEDVFAKVKEEMLEVSDELKKGSRHPELESEIGDLLFSVAQLARHCGFEPEQVLRNANRKFLDRYEAMHNLCKIRGLHFETLSLEEKEILWTEVKGKPPSPQK